EYITLSQDLASTLGRHGLLPLASVAGPFYSLSLPHPSAWGESASICKSTFERYLAYAASNASDRLHYSSAICQLLI
ncbi:hypothetical protein, partial [Paraburkholderia sp.]|uniref:hypothetical protein n=1 Tax=Paraburkholderia sp. TaxID=1926495 RepID=UPI003C7ED651